MIQAAGGEMQYMQDNTRFDPPRRFRRAGKPGATAGKDACRHAARIRLSGKRIVCIYNCYSIRPQKHE